MSTKRAPAFQFYVKDWLGDDKVLQMDWSARGLHMHFMCIAWQQDPPCTIPDDDAVMRRWANNPRNWKSLKESVLSAWKKKGKRWVQEGLLRQFKAQEKLRATRAAAANKRWQDRDANALHEECPSSATSLGVAEEEGSTPAAPGAADPDGPPSGSVNGMPKSLKTKWLALPPSWRQDITAIATDGFRYENKQAAILALRDIWSTEYPTAPELDERSVLACLYVLGFKEAAK